MTLQNIHPRKYQEEIFETCKTSSCLVILPTGIGKCISPDQLVLLGNGTLKKIENLYNNTLGKRMKNTKNHQILYPE